MRLYLPELLLLFCFESGVTSKALQDMHQWNSGKIPEQTLERQKISRRWHGHETRFLHARNQESYDRGEQRAEKIYRIVIQHPSPL
jgi:hypothetical protein